MSTTAQPGSEESLADIPAGSAAAVPGPLLAVYAHPDDETLQAGGVLALATAQGRRVVVVTATRGERGEMIGQPELEGTDAVAPERERELAAALAALGVTEHHWLDELASAAGAPVRWTDSGMVWERPGVAGPAPDSPPTALALGDLATQADALARLVREVRPAVVLCDEPHGSYGHPDHVRTHEITVAALAAAASDAPDGVAWDAPALAWVVQDSERRAAAIPAVAAAATEADARDAHGWPLASPDVADAPALVREPADIDLELDVTSVLPRVLAALRCYPSQVQAATVPALDSPAGSTRWTRSRLSPDQVAVGWYALSNDLLAPILPVVDLQAAHGDLAAAGLGPDTRSDVPSGSRAEHEHEPEYVGSRLTGGASTLTLLARGVGGLLLGVLAGGVGTLVHRVRPWDVPVGLLLALALVVVAGLLGRAVAKGAGLLGFGVGVIAVVQLLTFVGDGGDVLVPSDWIGTAWLLLSVLGVGLAAFLPRRWVGETRSRGPAR